MCAKSCIKKFYARRLRNTSRYLSHKWIGALGRVRPALFLPMSNNLRIINPSHRYEPIDVTAPLFFKDHPTQTAQLKDYLENPNLRPYDAKIIAARKVLVHAPSMIQRWRSSAFLEALLEDASNICYPKAVWHFETMPIRSATIWPTGVLLALPLCSNYYHWMIELLPRLQLLDEHPELIDLPLIVPAEAPGFLRETLRLSGYLNQVQFIQRGVQRFDSLYIPSLLSPPSHPSPKAVSWLREKLAAWRFPGAPTKHRRIYISRRDAPTRYATNEDEVVEMLARFGFVAVKLSDYTVIQQIRLFSEAHIIVGLHGAGLANLAFCFPGTYVLELFLTGWFTNAFYHISLIQKLRYGYLVCPKDGDGQYVPVGELKALVERVLKHSAEGLG
jgi:Glycosyltransferase 61